MFFSDQLFLATFVFVTVIVIFFAFAGPKSLKIKFAFIAWIVALRVN
jgi:hypothetical protein